MVGFPPPPPALFWILNPRVALFMLGFGFPPCVVVARVCAVATMLGGLVVMLAWIGGFAQVTAIVPGAVLMKFVTALCFFLSGVLLFELAGATEGKETAAEVVIAFCTLVILLLMSSILISYFFGVQTGIEDLFVKENPEEAFGGLAGKPALATIFAFMAVAALGLLSFLEKRDLAQVYEAGGAAIAAVGLVSLVAYGLGLKFLLFYLESVAPPIAISTAFLFSVLGIGVFALGKKCEASSEGGA